MIRSLLPKQRPRKRNRQKHVFPHSRCPASSPMENGASNRLYIPCSKARAAHLMLDAESPKLALHWDESFAHQATTCRTSQRIQNQACLFPSHHVRGVPADHHTSNGDLKCQGGCDTCGQCRCKPIERNVSSLQNTEGLDCRIPKGHFVRGNREGMQQQAGAPDQSAVV